MNFDWSAEQEGIYERVLGHTRQYLGPKIAERSPRSCFPRSEWKWCGEAGLLGLSVPLCYGGRGLGCVSTARAMEAFGLGCEDTGLVFAVAAHQFACAMPIVEHGIESLKQRVLPRMCAGEWVGANAATETEAGSDVFAMEATAIRDGDHYVLNGAKSFVTNGPIADVLVVYACSNPANGFLGINSFVVERGSCGLIVDEPFEKLGLNSIPSSAVRLKECRVPATQRLGEEGQGGMIFQRSMLWERTCLFAGYLGMMRRQLEQVVAHAQKRQQFGKRIGKYQAVSHRIAQMKLRLDAAQLLLYRACWMLDQGGNATLDVSLAKLAISEAAVRSSLDAIQIFGGAGYQTEAGIERGLRDSLAANIASGTSEMQHEIIARELGL